MTDLPQAAIDAAMDTIERLGAGGSRTTVRIVLAAAAPHIRAAERERIRQLAISHDARYNERRGGVIHQHLLFADLLTEGGQAGGT